MIKFLPNIITIFRIILVPFFIYCIVGDFENSKLYAAIIFCVASISDFLDGKIARKYGIITRFGTFMDPLADKILVLSAFLTFVFLEYIPLWMVIVIVMRDFFITVLRMFMERNGITMVTSKVGKIKTAIQMMAINVILFYMIILSYNISEIIYLFDNFSIIYIFMFITTMITFITGLDYFVKNHGAIKVIFINRE